MALNTYTPPSTSVREITSPSITPLLASAADICLVGVAGNTQDGEAPLTTVDPVLLTDTNPVVLPTLAALNNDASLVSVLSVKDVLNPSVGTPIGSGYAAGQDYVVQLGEGPPDGTGATIARTDTGNIAQGTLVAVEYSYLPTDYWNPIRLFDIGSVESRFGDSWAKSVNQNTGQVYYTGINSQLSFAARLAFANGADSVICQPLHVRETPGNYTSPQLPPSATAVGDASTWQDTLYMLRPYDNIDVIVPVVGQDQQFVSPTAVLDIFSTVQGYQAFMAQEQQYVVAIFGEDGTSSKSAFQNLLTLLPSNHAPSLQANFGNQLSSQCVLLNNTVFQVPTPGGYTNAINVGGQYAAAAVAGALGARPVASSLTHSSIIGFSGVSDPRTPSDKNNDAASGLMVIENYQGVLRVRHGITLDIQNGPARAELSVVRAKFMMMESIRETIDNQIIGRIIADANSPMVVRSAISGILALLQEAGAIVAYSPVQAALTSINPTIIKASFSYRPSFPVDYVDVTFSLDLTNQLVTTVDTTTTNST